MSIIRFFSDLFIDIGLNKIIAGRKEGQTNDALEVLVSDCEHGGIKHIKSFPVLLQSVHVSDDVIAFFGMCLGKGTMDSSGCLIPMLFVYRNEGLPHGIGSFTMCNDMQGWWTPPGFCQGWTEGEGESVKFPPSKNPSPWGGCQEFLHCHHLKFSSDFNWLIK